MTDPITQEERAKAQEYAHQAMSFIRAEVDSATPPKNLAWIFAYEAALSASEAEVERLQGRERSLLDIIDAIYLYANDTLSGRADGGPDDRDWQRASVIEIRNRARQFATVESAVDARAALTGEKP